MSGLGWRWWTRVLTFRMPSEYVEPNPLTARQMRADVYFDHHVEMDERAAMPCLDCEIGEPHVCEAAYWQQKVDHAAGNQCADDECTCHFLTVPAYRPRPTPDAAR